MSRFMRIGVTGLAALALAGGAAAVTAMPAEAAIKGKGTVSARESDKVLRAMSKQRCLTIKETQRDREGQGHQSPGYRQEPSRGVVVERHRRSRQT